MNKKRVTTWVIEFSIYNKQYTVEAYGDDEAERMKAQINDIKGSKILSTKSL